MDRDSRQSQKAVLRISTYASLRFDTLYFVRAWAGGGFRHEALKAFS